MCKYLINILLFFLLMVQCSLSAQTNRYSVSLAPFSTAGNNEFAPVYYKQGIVFCSDMKDNSFITYQKGEETLFNIFFTPEQSHNNLKGARLLAKKLTTGYNEGPATFNEAGNIIYYCRNNEIIKVIRNSSDTTNKLGIYSAEFINGEWENIKPFTFNNPLYSFVTPALTPNGTRLYFASDMPGGFGGYDLYYCELQKDEWDNPVNMGPAINTPENESYPFADKYGKLFFASEGHNSLGGKDIFFTKEVKGEWIIPVQLDEGINSPYDDFGIVTDENVNNGFFSSNRRKNDDIFHFATDLVEFSDCDSMIKNNYCYLFTDERLNTYDAIPVVYEWDFGNGVIRTGTEVRYCFPGPGKYEVRLNIIDGLLHDSILGHASYEFELEEIKQVYICSPDTVIIGDTVMFDGYKTNLPGFIVSDYLWNFGDGFTVRGPSTSRIFEKKGEYTVSLGLLGEKDTLGIIPKACTYKKVRVLDDYQELATQKENKPGEAGVFNESNKEK